MTRPPPRPNRQGRPSAGASDQHSASRRSRPNAGERRARHVLPPRRRERLGFSKLTAGSLAEPVEMRIAAGAVDCANERASTAAMGGEAPLPGPRSALTPTRRIVVPPVDLAAGLVATLLVTLARRVAATSTVMATPGSSASTACAQPSAVMEADARRVRFAAPSRRTRCACTLARTVRAVTPVARLGGQHGSSYVERHRLLERASRW